MGKSIVPPPFVLLSLNNIWSGTNTFNDHVIGNSDIVFSGAGTFGGLIINGVSGLPTGLTNTDFEGIYGSTADATLVNLTSSTGDFATDAVSPAYKFRYNTTGIGFYTTSPIAKPGATTDLGTVLSGLGLRTAGTAYPMTTSGAVDLSGTITFSTFSVRDSNNISVGSTTGCRFGTATTQKIGFWNSVPVVQTTGATDVLAGLVTIGLRAASSNPPLNLGTGALTCGNATVGDLTANGMTTSVAKVTITDATNVQLGTTTGTKLGTGTTQKLGFYNATPVVQQTDGAGVTNNVTSGGTTNQIDNYTDLVIYANDAAAIRNDIYQLARKLKIVDDALRTYGLLS